MLRNCLLLACLALLCSACRRHPGQAEAAVPFPLPAGWPLEALTVPEDAVTAVLPGAFPADDDNPGTASGAEFNPHTPNSGRMWSVAYKSKLSWEEQLTHYGGQHEELRYQINWNKPLTREFISPDGLFITQLHYDVESGVSVLSIFAYDESWPGARPFGT